MSRRELEQPCPEQWTHYEKTGERIVDFCKRKAKQHVKDDAPYLIAVGEQMSFDFDQDEGFISLSLWKKKYLEDEGE